MGVAIHAYGVFLALAFVAGIGMGVVQGRKLGYSTDRVLDLAVWFLLSAMIGSRLLYILLYPRQFPTFLSWFAINQGGLVFFGGFLATAITVVVYGRFHGLRLRDLGDMIAPSLILGHAVGRLGCFANGCCYGRPTGLSWGVVIDRLGDHLPRHPTQLYEALFLTVLLVTALMALPNRMAGGAVFPGAVWGGYVLLYSGFRFGIEFLRDDDRGGFFTPAALSVSQCISLAGMAASLLWLELCRRKQAENPRTGESSHAENG